MEFSTLASASFLSREDRKAYLTAMEREERSDAQRAYDKGYADRKAGRNMAEAWTMRPGVQNAYRNGYVAACG